MPSHINEQNQFQSDLHPELPPDKIILSFKDPLAREALALYANGTSDIQLGQDIMKRIGTIVE